MVLSSVTVQSGQESIFGHLQPGTHKTIDTTHVRATKNSAFSHPVLLATTTTASRAQADKTRDGMSRIVCGTVKTAELKPALAAHEAACHSSPKLWQTLPPMPSMSNFVTIRLLKMKTSEFREWRCLSAKIISSMVSFPSRSLLQCLISSVTSFSAKHLFILFVPFHFLLKNKPAKKKCSNSTKVTFSYQIQIFPLLSFCLSCHW